ncbi:hypothetical protein [Pseudomonas sp. NMS19W]|uniref:hypothetical protein n=1 Tax=Pseudomonas sp. NMS19W TaxID=3079768 RepID=UPI003F65EF13
MSGDEEAQRRFDEYQRDTRLATVEDDVSRLTAERDALQQRLNAADQRIDEVVSAVRSINRGRHHEVFMPGDDEPRYAQRKEWVDWILALCDETSATPKPFTEQFLEDHLGKQPDQLRDHTKMIAAHNPDPDFS